jgi:hypothetical protein
MHYTSGFSHRQQHHSLHATLKTKKFRKREGYTRTFCSKGDQSFVNGDSKPPVFDDLQENDLYTDKTVRRVFIWNKQQWEMVTDGHWAVMDGEHRRLLISGCALEWVLDETYKRRRSAKTPKKGNQNCE